MKRLIPVLLATLTGLTLLSCGSSQAPGSANLESPIVRQLPGQPQQSLLPSLADLPHDDKQPSLAGPGWHGFDLNQPNVSTLMHGTTDAAPALQFAAAPDTAFRVWGLGQFNADNFPTSVDVQVSSVSGEYYIAYADYISGRWQMAGPFTASTQFEYPSGDEHGNPLGYVSPYGFSYVAVIVPAGGSLQLDSLALGVHGGTEGPLPVRYFEQLGGPTNVICHWLNSPSSIDPDFAGYIVQRKVLFGTTWVDQNTQPLFETYFIDDTALLGQIYTYRVNTLDSSGHVALGLPKYFKAGAAADSRPVIIVDMPMGPFFGPVELSFDLSQSFDPDGEPLTTYKCDFGSGIGELSQPTPQFTVTLQPGTYQIAFTAESSTSNYTIRALKVYPQWQESPSLVEAGVGTVPRTFLPQTVLNRDGESTTVFFHDLLLPGITAVTTTRSGETSYSFLPLHFDYIFKLSEPVQFDDGYIFTATANGSAYVVAWNGSSLSIQYDLNFSVAAPFVKLMVDGTGQFHVAYYKPNGLNYDLIVLNITTGTTLNLLTAVPSPMDFDCEYNANENVFDAVVNSANMSWLRFTMAGILDSQVVSLIATQNVEMVENPLTGNPEVAWFEVNQVMYSAYDQDLLTWPPGQIVDGSDPNQLEFDLNHFAGDTYIAMIQLTGPTAKIYRRNGANWDLVHTAAYLDNPSFLFMEELPGEPGLRLYGMLGSTGSYLYQARFNGTQDLLHSIENIWGSGINLSALSDSTDIHCIQNFGSNLLHFSSPDGIAWAPAALPVLPASKASLGTDSLGKLHISYVSGGFAYLDEWNGAGFVNVANSGINLDASPFVSQEGTLHWGFTSNVPGTYSYYNEGAALVNSLLDGLPVWDGSIVASSSGFQTCVLHGGASLSSAEIGLLRLSTLDVEYVADGASSLYELNQTEGRLIDGASYIDSSGIGTQSVWYITSTDKFIPARIEIDIYGNPEITYLPFTQIDMFTIPEVRRTSSCMQAWGNTSVGLVASFSGAESYMEWDNYGNWEQLQLPLANMSLPELVTGPDGRWHIIYRDLVSDDLMIISTVN